jgi:hypothetical protein
MDERQKEIVCVFDLKSPRISAYDILVLIDSPQRHVYIKLPDNNLLQQVLHLTRGQAEYRHTKGEISMVRVETAGL